MGYQIAADENHDDEWKPHDGKRSQDGTQPGCPDGIALMQTGGITHVGGAVDADRTRSRLADSHNICRPWGEMRLEMMDAAYGMMTQQELHKVKDAPYEEVIQNEQLNMMFNIQRSQVRLTAHASGDVVCGKKLNARIPVLADRDEVEEVLSA